MIAFTDFLAVAARCAYGESVTIKADVYGIAKGSFSIQFMLDLGGVLANIFSGPVSIKDLYDIIRDSFAAWRHLQGENPASIQPTQSNTACITNNSGEVIQVNIGALNLLSNEKASKAVMRFVGKALETEGMESLLIETEDHELMVRATRDQAPWFIPIATGATLSDYTHAVALHIESATFKEGNKWRFNDGQASFSAAITDQKFMDRVASGAERFGKGDILLVELNVVQRQVGTSFKTERAIVKVKQHRTAHDQTDWLIEPPG